MPKQKTKKCLVKRFRKTATGKLKRSQAGHRHLMACKSAKRRRQQRADQIVFEGDAQRILPWMPK